MKDLQEQIETKEKELNFEVGAWVRKETNLDTLHDIQQNFRLVPIENENEKSSIITHTYHCTLQCRYDAKVGFAVCLTTVYKWRNYALNLFNEEF